MIIFKFVTIINMYLNGITKYVSKFIICKYNYNYKFINNKYNNKALTLTYILQIYNLQLQIL